MNLPDPTADLTVPGSDLDGEQNPFLRYRERLDSYRVAINGGLSDAAFVDIVSSLDAQVAAVDRTGFVVTPVIDGHAVASATGAGTILAIKIEAGNVGGSHKARHLFGAAIHQLVAEALGAEQPERLAIASCGNAAIGASVIARALDRELDVFVPVWAEESVITTLDGLGANINRCERRDGEAGDPCYLRFSEQVTAGAQPFSVQGIDTPTTFDGGRTLGWEFDEQVPQIDSLYIQVGGGALATSVSLAMRHARLFPVQAEGCAPLRRAWDLLAPGFDFQAASREPGRFMWPWEDEPTSLATGILDDVAYDWLPLLQRTQDSGGHPIVAPEPEIVRAFEVARSTTHVPVCSTGTAGLAGLLTEPASAGDHVGVIFSGVDRT